jgi:hypothetical protein
MTVKTMSQNNSDDLSQPLTDVERRIIKAISSIRYGSVQVVLFDGRVVQVEKCEKERFDTKVGKT